MALKGLAVVASDRIGRVTAGSAHACATATCRVANRPVVCHALDALRAAGASELAITVPRDRVGEIRQCIESDGVTGPELTYIPGNDAGGLLDALHSARAFAERSPCIVHGTDGVVGEPLAPFAALAGADRPDLVVLLCQSPHGREGVDRELHRLLDLPHPHPSRIPDSLADVFVVGAGALPAICSSSDQTSPPSTFNTMARRVAASGGTLHVGQLRAWRRYRGSRTDLLEMNRIVLDQLPADTDVHDVRGNRIEGRVAIDPTAEITASVIFGPVIIGHRARISDSYIGPYTAIGARTLIEGAEIERSIVFDGAHISHVGHRIEASTVGCDARVFRDFALPRAVRLHIGAGDEVALS